MEAVEAYKIFGPLSAVAIWAAMLFIIKKWPGHRGMTVSAHAAAYKEAYLLLAIVCPISYPFFALFMFGWFIPVLQLPLAFSWLAGLILILDFIIAWVPQHPGWKGIVHKLGAYAMASTFLPFAIMLARAPAVSGTARAVIWTCILLMALFWVIFVASKRSKGYFLYFQLTYFLLFDITFLAAAFL